MTALRFVDAAPTFEKRGDIILMTVTSGDEETTFAVTRYALGIMAVRARRARETSEAEKAVVVPFKAKRGRKAK